MDDLSKKKKHTPHGRWRLQMVFHCQGEKRGWRSVFGGNGRTDADRGSRW